MLTDSGHSQVNATPLKTFVHDVLCQSQASCTVNLFSTLTDLLSTDHSSESYPVEDFRAY